MGDVGPWLIAVAAVVITALQIRGLIVVHRQNVRTLEEMRDHHRRERDELKLRVDWTIEEVGKLTEERRRFEEYRRWQRRGPWARL